MIGEIIESRTWEFIVETIEYDFKLPYGSFVRAVDEGRIIYGIVARTATTSIDNNVRAKAFFKSLDELKLEQPQIFSLLRTEAHCIVLGYREDGVYRPYYPPTHLPLHLQVEFADEDEIMQITDGLSYLIKTIEAKDTNCEELTAAALRKAASLRENKREYLVMAGRELFKILDYDTQKLKSIMERVDIV